MLDDKEGELAREKGQIQGILKVDPRLSQWQDISLPPRDPKVKRGQTVTEEMKLAHLRNVQVDYEKYLADTYSVLVTSPAPGDGKTTVATNLAITIAQSGKRVLLIDADLRLPTHHTIFSIPEPEQAPGLSGVLAGQATLNDAVRRSPVEGLDLLPCGPRPKNPAELLNSQAMHDLHEALKDRCDIVIFDSPPSLATADAQVLSADVDGVLYVVQFGEAKKSAVRHAGDLLRQARARVLGVVFNKIDLAANRDDYYYGYYRSYYRAKEEEVRL